MFHTKIRNISLSSEKWVAYKKSVCTLIFLYNKHVSSERLYVFLFSIRNKGLLGNFCKSQMKACSFRTLKQQ